MKTLKERLFSGEKLTLKDVHGDDFEVQYENFLTLHTLTFTQNGKLCDKRTMNLFEIETYINQFEDTPEAELNRKKVDEAFNRK